jgi:capsular polysaccharide transport system ATP-binding protein
MIILDQLSKTVGPFFKRRSVLAAVTLQIPTDQRIALVSQPEEDKKRLIELLAGTAKPTSGTITRLAEVSFPVGHQLGFAKEHTVRLNVAHIARLYGADVAATVDVVEQVLDMGKAFDKSYEHMSRKLRQPLAQAVALALPFDLYLLTDDRLGRSGAGRGGRSAASTQLLFEARAKTSGMIIPTRNVKYAREICHMALVLRNGALELFKNVDEAFDAVGRRGDREGRGDRRERVLKLKRRSKVDG